MNGVNWLITRLRWIKRFRWNEIGDYSQRHVVASSDSTEMSDWPPWVKWAEIKEHKVPRLRHPAQLAMNHFFFIDAARCCYPNTYLFVYLVCSHAVFAPDCGCDGVNTEFRPLLCCTLQLFSRRSHSPNSAWLRYGYWNQAAHDIRESEHKK